MGVEWVKGRGVGREKGEGTGITLKMRKYFLKNKLKKFKTSQHYETKINSTKKLKNTIKFVLCGPSTARHEDCP